MQINKFRITNDILFNVTSDVENYITLRKLPDAKQFVSGNVDNLVFTSTSYVGYINKIYDSLPIISELALVDVETKFSNVSFKLRAGFDFTNVFGFLVIIYKTSTSEYLMSEVLNINNFKISDINELYGNEFWNVEYNTQIPVITEDTIMYVEPITYDDILDDGLILIYPRTYKGFTPLVANKVVPPTILTSINIDDKTNYLNILPYTTNTNKTLEQELLDYFGFTDKVVPITVNHTVRYGNEENYKQIKVSNDINKYGLISIGLDFTGFDLNNIKVYVSTEYSINNNLNVVRDATIFFSYAGVFEPIVEDLIKPIDGELIVLPVTITEEIITNQNIINTPVETKVNTIYQKIYVEIVDKDFIWDSKHILFDNLLYNQNYILEYGNQKLFSKKTVNNGIYFDLINATKPTEVTDYKVFNTNTGELVMKGTINI